MATKNDTINIWVKVKGGAESSLRSFNKTLKKTDDGVKKTGVSFGKLSVGIGAMAILGKTAAWMKENTKLAMIQLDAESKLTQAYGKSADALFDYAAELQKVTIYGDEETIASMALVANFVKEEEQIKAITRAAQNLAAAKGMSLATATDLVTKSVSSSANAMSRYGITVEGEAGSVERITSAIDALNDAFGGTAEAIAQTDSGKIKQMDNAIGDLREEVGEQLLPAIVDVKQATLDFYNVILENKGPVIGAVRKIAELMGETIGVADWLLGGGDEKKRLDLLQDITNQTEAVEEYQKALKNAESQKPRPAGVSAYAYGGGSDQAQIDMGIISAKRLLNDAYLALASSKKQLNDLSADDATEVDDTEKSTVAIDTNTVSVKKNAVAKKEAVEQYKIEYGEIETIQIDRADSLAEANAMELEQKRETAITSVDIAQQAANDISNIMGAVNSNKQADFDADIARQKDSVKSSNLSRKQQETANAKIDKDAAKERHKLRLTEWRQNLVMSIANTALAVTKTMATMGYPVGIPFAIAAGVSGLISTGIIAANKPKMYNGGKLQSQTGMVGDVVPFIGRAGETVGMDNKKTVPTTVTIGAPIVNINGNADDNALQQLQSMYDNYAKTIEDLFTSGQINSDIINTALSS